MGTNVVNGLLARYNAVPLVLSDKATLALQVTENNALMTTSSLPVGSGQATWNKLNGQPARYNENLLTLQDGQGTAIQTDVNGNTIISFV